MFLEGAEFSLTGKTEDGKEVITKAISDKTGLVRFYGLDSGEYTLREIKAPAGYLLPDKGWTVKVEHEAEVIHSPNVGDDGSKIEDYPDNLSDEQTMILEGAGSIHLKLFYQTEDKWDTISLYNNGNIVTKDKNGQKIGNDGFISGGLYEDIIRTEDFDFAFNKLTVKLKTDEGSGGYGYYGILSHQNVTIKDGDGNDLALSKDNTYQIPNALETVTVSGMKTWDDNDDRDGKRPESITVRLLKDGEEIDSQKVRAEDGWKWSFSDLPKYDGDREITYAITEDTVEEYSTKISGYDVTNTHTPEKTSVQVTKVWVDGNNRDGKRPESVTVKLLADGKETGDKLILSENNRWEGTFDNLDEYKKGKKVVYTVKEDEIGNGYEVTISGDASRGFKITNSRTPETLTVTGMKTWDDNDDRDGKRPNAITIRLLKNGKEIDSAKITSKGGWKWNFNDLPKYEGGREITYTITEDAVKEYSAEISGYDVTNTHTPGKTSVQVTKAWDDGNDYDGKRPESVTVKLLADGKETGDKLILSENNKWTGTFVELDEFKEGEKINYTIEEIEVDGYTSSIEGTMAMGFVITNRHEPDRSHPATGDNSGTDAWLNIFILSLSGAILSILLKTRKKQMMK